MSGGQTQTMVYRSPKISKSLGRLPTKDNLLLGSVSKNTFANFLTCLPVRRSESMISPNRRLAGTSFCGSVGTIGAGTIAWASVNDSKSPSTSQSILRAL